MSTYAENSVVAGTKLLRRSDGSTLATFSSLSAAQYCYAQLREGNTASSRWHSPGPTTAGDRTTFDALPSRP